MDRIIWDGQSLQTITSQLRRASRQLDDCENELRRLCQEAETVLGQNAGQSQRILQQLEHACRKTVQHEERATALASAMVRVREMIASAEASIAGMAAQDVGKPRSGTTAASPFSERVSYFHASPSVTGVTPDWLRQAADRSFLR